MTVLVEQEALSQFTRIVYGRTSSDWNQQNQPWLGNVGKVVLSAIGASEIRFIFGSPGSHINETRRDGHLWVFTDELLADVMIEHPDQQIGYPPPTPLVSVRAVSRSSLRSLTIRDSKRMLAHADEDYGGWPTQVVLELDYGSSEPLIIEFSGDNTLRQQTALLELLPSLRNDLHQRSIVEGKD